MMSWAWETGRQPLLFSDLRTLVCYRYDLLLVFSASSPQRYTADSSQDWLREDERTTFFRFLSHMRGCMILVGSDKSRFLFCTVNI